MKDAAHFQYRCRRCGIIETGSTTGASRADMVLVGILTRGDSGPGIPIRMLGIHRCDDDGCGVTDLIGYQVQ